MVAWSISPSSLVSEIRATCAWLATMSLGEVGPPGVDLSHPWRFWEGHEDLRHWNWGYSIFRHPCLLHLMASQTIPNKRWISDRASWRYSCCFFLISRHWSRAMPKTMAVTAELCCCRWFGAQGSTPSLQICRQMARRFGTSALMKSSGKFFAWRPWLKNVKRWWSSWILEKIARNNLQELPNVWLQNNNGLKTSLHFPETNPFLSSSCLSSTVSSLYSHAKNNKQLDPIYLVKDG